MKLAIACDYKGYELKKYIIKHIKGIDIVDLGCDSSDIVDYPKYAFKLGEYVVKNKCLGIAICGTGIGISIACNKVKGIRCARVTSIKDAAKARMINDANILAFSSEINPDRAVKMVANFYETEFSNLERRVRRNSQINEYEEKHNI